MYTNFAYIYDEMMYDVDYKKWADYIEKIFKRYRQKPSLILDLGCGTGSFTLEMAKRGYEMIGIDISPDMLSCARSKAENAGTNILYLNQDMTEFELYGTVDAVVCLMDSVNYVTVKKELQKLFKLVNNYLNPGGLFIFDINTCYKFDKVLDGNVFYDVGDDITYIWENRFDKRKGICQFDLTFFVREGINYRKYEEIHLERAYTQKEVSRLIDNSGMELINIYNEMEFKPPFNESLRNFFVCRERGKTK
ncbi:MAG: class I SAM-dependent methyltransferase [Clostridia bacterium]|nr:class I SAM-dependent methyltransferase [Clostridia bacterium]